MKKILFLLLALIPCMLSTDIDCPNGYNVVCSSSYNDPFYYFFCNCYTSSQYIQPNEKVYTHCAADEWATCEQTDVFQNKLSCRCYKL